jgi:PAS domain-containing protein
MAAQCPEKTLMATAPITLNGESTATGASFYDSLEMLCNVQFDGRVTEANPSLLHALGYAESDLVG